MAERIEEAAASLGEFAAGRPGRVTGTYEKVIVGLPYILAYEFFAHATGSETVGILRLIHTSRRWTEGEWPES